MWWQLTLLIIAFWLLAPVDRGMMSGWYIPLVEIVKWAKSGGLKSLRKAKK